MPTFSTKYLLTNGAIAAGTALADVEHIAGAFKTYTNITHLNGTASAYPDRFTEGQIVYVSASNELFKMSKYFDDQITFTDIVISQSFQFPGGSIPAGTISGSPQIAELGYLTSASAAAAGFGSGGGTTTDISALNTFTSSAQISLTALNSATSSYALKTDISGAFTSVSSSVSTRLTTLEGTSGGDVTALNLFTGSAQTSLTALNSATSSYLTSASTGSFILTSQTSSMSVLSALTASFISSTFISASAAASGFGSGGGSVGTLQQVTDQGTSTTNAITASAFSGSYFDFNTDGNPVSAVAGRLTWNDSDGTLNIGMGYSDVVLQVGQEQHYVVRNNTGTTISNGVAVYASGSTAGVGRIEAAPYTANGLIREVRFLGLATHDISDGVNGVVTRFGYVRDLDTRGIAATPISVGDEDWSVGDILYVHPTVAGKLTNVKPKHAVYVAIVTVRHQTTGVLFVRPFSYGHMDDIHDVSINTSSLATGNVLVYNSSSDAWENSDSVNLALTASYISPTFISASAAAAGFGSGGGSINTDSFATTGSNTFKGEQIISSSLIVTNEIKGTGSIFLQPDVNDGRKLEIYNTAATDVHIKSNGGLTFLGDDTNYVLVDDYSQTVTVNGVNGVFVNSSLNVSGSLIVTGSINVPGSVINNLTSSFATTASFISDLFISASAVRSGFGTALFPSGLLSSSFQIANDISGAFTSLSSSFASRITALEGAGGGNGIFTLTGSFYSTTNNIQITGSLSVGSGSFKSFEVDSDGFVVLGDMDKDLNNAPVGTIAYSGSNFYLIS
jgi:hypothetical protein